MNKREKISPGGANAWGETTGEAGSFAESALAFQSTITARQTQGAVSQFLPQGEKNAVSKAELVRLTGCKSPRQLQKLIAEEREQGIPILSSCRGGYFLPQPGEAGRAEMEAYCRTLQARAVNTFRALRTVRKLLAEPEGQEHLEEVLRP